MRSARCSLLSIVAAAISALLFIPARRRLADFSNRLVHGARRPPHELLRTFGVRLSRALPLDELLLQLAESLQSALALEAAEIWTGSGGVFERVVSEPERGPAMLRLTASEEAVVARTGVSGQSGSPSGYRSSSPIAATQPCGSPRSRTQASSSA